MKKLVIFCDKCNKEIEGKPARVGFYDTTRDSEDPDQPLYTPGEDYCVDCVTELIALIDNFKPKPEEKVKKEKKKATPKKKADKGKIWALREAGWTIKDIALDVGCSVGTVHRVLQGERPVPEYAKENAADLE